MKILFYDIETFPILGYVWGMHQVDVIAIKRDWRLACFAYKWQGSEKVKWVSLSKLGTERAVVKALWKLFNEADLIVAQNGQKFDDRKARAKFVQFGLKPTRPTRFFDPYLHSKRHFSFSSHSLNAVAKLFKLNPKKSVGFSVWEGCMTNDPASWRTMKEYNIHDVVLLEEYYNIVRPWTNHPTIASKAGLRCPVCDSVTVQFRGSSIGTSGRIIQRFQCKSCGKWGQLAKTTPSGRLLK